MPCSSTPAGPAGDVVLPPGVAFRYPEAVGSRENAISGLNSKAYKLPVYASRPGLLLSAQHSVPTVSTLGRTGLITRRVPKKVSALHASPSSRLCLAHQDSTNSNKPPSSDNPFTKGKESAPKSAKAKKTRKGTRQQCLRPTKITEIFPGKCICGCGNLTDIEPYYTHQVVELPEIELEVTHLILYREALPALPESSKGARCAGTKSGLWPEIVGDDCRDGRKPS